MNKAFGWESGNSLANYDQVVDTFADLLQPGNDSTIYYVIGSNTFYYWNGTVYLPINTDLPQGALTNDISGGQGWNATTNVPAITSSVGNQGDFAIVSVTGTTLINGINLWSVGDYIWFDHSNNVWRKIDNQGTIASSKRIEFVVNNEAEFQSAYTEINNNYEGGIIRLGSEMSLSKNHSFSHENIVIECDYNRFYLNGHTITIAGNSCYYNNGFFDANSPGAQFIFNAGQVSTNYLFYNCRFHNFLDWGSAIIWNAANVSGSAHLFLKDCWVSSGAVNISSNVALYNVVSTNAFASMTITGFRSESVNTESRRLGLTGVRPSGAGSSIKYDGTCVISNVLNPDRTFLLLSETLSNYALLSGATFTGEIVGTTIKARHKRTIQSITSSATFTHNCDSYDTGKITAQAVALTIAAPTGTPYDLQEFLLYLKDDGTSKAITWNAAFSSIMETLPTATTAGKQMVLGFAYNTVTSKWELISLLIGL